MPSNTLRSSDKNEWHERRTRIDFMDGQNQSNSSDDVRCDDDDEEDDVDDDDDDDSCSDEEQAPPAAKVVASTATVSGQSTITHSASGNTLSMRQGTAKSVPTNQQHFYTQNTFSVCLSLFIGVFRFSFGFTFWFDFRLRLESEILKCFLDVCLYIIVYIVVEWPFEVKLSCRIWKLFFLSVFTASNTRNQSMHFSVHESIAPSHIHTQFFLIISSCTNDFHQFLLQCRSRCSRQNSRTIYDFCSFARHSDTLFWFKNWNFSFVVLWLLYRKLYRSDENTDELMPFNFLFQITGCHTREHSLQ